MSILQSQTFTPCCIANYVLASVLTCLCLSALSCKKRPADSQVHLVGGSGAKTGMFPASIHIPNCSAVRFNQDSILTAAHCILNDAGILEKAYQPGAQLNIDHGAQLATATRTKIDVIAAYVHPTYLQAIEDGIDVDSNENVVDLALVKVQGLADTIDKSHLVSESLQVNSDVLFTGYGCEKLPQHHDPLQDFDQAFAKADPKTELEKTLRLKFKRTPFVGYLGSVGQVVNVLDNPQLLGEEKKEPFSGCPGDSGSAVYLPEGDDPMQQVHKRIVGINSFIGPFRSSFTRLDSSKPFEIGECLQAVASLPLPSLEQLKTPEKPLSLCEAKPDQQTPNPAP